MQGLSVFITDFEPQIRLGLFVFTLSAIMIWEIIRPRRALSQSKSRRWLNNLGIVVVNTLALRVVFPVAAVGASILAEQNAWGLFNHLGWPLWIEVICCLLLLDVLIYGQHVLMHKVPVLWRLHRMHHLDLDFDVTTGLRFHPIEILLSMGIKWLVILLLGVPVLAAIVFEILLSSISLFNHANGRLPIDLDRRLRLLLVTPDMHRVHHSVIRNETDSNYGFNLSWWDRLFGTYRDQPLKGHLEMEIGQREWRDPGDCVSLLGMLKSPFKSAPQGH